MRETWYPRNREKQRQLVRANELRLREFISTEKVRRGGCEECGYNAHPVALDFHHRAGEIKEFTIASAAKRGLSTARIESEMQKCVLLCANCHRVHHYA